MKIFSGKKKQPAKALNLRRHAAPVFLMLVSAGLLYYASIYTEQPVQQVDNSAEHRARAKQLALQISEQVAPISGHLRVLSTQPGLEEKLREHNSALMATEDEAIPGLLSLRLLGKDALDVFDLAKPELSYACYDLVAETINKANKEQQSLAEAHLFGSPTQHVDFTYAVRNEQGRAVGALIASVSINILQDLLPKPGTEVGYIELQQAGKALAKAGSGAARTGEPYKAQIGGTRWQLAYWPLLTPTTAEVVTQYSAQQRWIGIAAAVIFVIAVGMFLPGFVRGTRQRLEENAARRAAAKQAAREQAEQESTPIEQGQDLVFQKGDGLVVEEIDESDLVPQNADSKVASLASIFKAYDIRGVVGETLTEDVVYNIGRALGSEALQRGQQVIAVGRDGRNSGKVLVTKLVNGLRASGINVIHVGLVPTPVLYFAAQALANGTGVMLTGSHNPPNYNGLKMVIGGTTLARDDIQALRRRVEEADFVTGKGELENKDVSQAYQQRITQDIMLFKHFRVVVDCGNGAAGKLGPALLKAIGCDVIELYCDIDGNFPNHHPDPSRPENLQDLVAAVAQHNADLGLAFDGDGDRLGVVTSEGRIIWPDRIMMLYAMDILSRNPGAEIIFDVKCSTKLRQVIEQHGGKATMWNTGHSLIKAKMKETGALLAGEMSGHIFFKERWFGFDDGLYSAARLVELLGPMTADRSVADVFNDLPDSVNTPELNIHMKEGEHHAFMEKLLASATFTDAEVTTLDGLRVDFADGWGLVRASNTTPCLVLRFEADNDKALQRIQARFREVMQATDPDIELSF